MAVAVAGSVVGCSGDDDGAVPLTEPSSGSVTTVPETTSTTLDFETEVKLAALELLELRNEVFQNPDESRVSEYIADTCVCLEAERGFIRDLAAANARWTEPPFIPLGIRLEDRTRTNPAFTVVARQPAGSVVGPSTSSPVREVSLAPLFMSLVRDSEGRWRINALDEIPIADEVARRIVQEEGMP